jgi:WD repeat-containing protein 7
LGGHNLLLIYDDQRARLWDTKTKELWRSVGLEKAEELITQGGWSDLYVIHLIGFAFLNLFFFALLENA